MKKIIGIISVLLAIVFTFSSCSFSVNPESIERIVSNISNTEQLIVPLSEEYNGRKNYYYSSLSAEEKIEYTKIYNSYMNKKDFTVNVTEDKLSIWILLILFQKALRVFLLSPNIDLMMKKLKR